MRRRRAIQSLLGLPILTALPAFPQQAATDKSKPEAQEKLPPELKPAPVEEFPKLALTGPEVSASGMAGFFNPVEFANLSRLCSLMVPAAGGKPGAIEAEVPDFLDFLIGQSPGARQHLYRTGLDLLQKGAQRRYQKTFAELSDSEGATQLEPLREAASTPSAAGDELRMFLQASKEDILRATFNSRQWAGAATQRRGAAVGTYWRSIE